MTFEGFPLNVDLFWAVQKLRNPLLDTFFTKFYLLGKGGIVIPIAGIVYWKFRDRFWLFVLGLVIESVTVQGLKHLLNQPRPGLFFKDFHPLEHVYHYSFPSGDTALTFYLLAFFWNSVSTPWRVILILYATLIGFGRIYLGAHFPLDVLVGAFIGVISYLIAERIFERLKRKGN